MQLQLQPNYRRVASLARAVSFIGGAWIIGTAPASAVPVSNYTFTGGSTLGTPTVTTTLEGGGPVVAPGLVYPELTPGTSFDLSDGFGVAGRFDFLNGSGTAAELQFTASRPFTITTGVAFTAAMENGYFGINSGDITTGIDTGSNAVTATLTTFSTTTSIQTISSTTVAGLSSTATDGNQTIPLTATDFPNNAYHSVAGPVSTSNNFISADSYVLLESVDIKIGNLLPGESVDIDLPTYSTINSTSVPEPASLGMVVLGGSAMMLKRRRV